MKWKALTFLVCLYGFLKEYRPSEAYLSAYLTGPWKNLTEQEVNNEIYPVWTYSYLVWMVPIFLLTDYLRYQPMLVLGGAAYVGTWALLLWAQGVLAMKLMQVSYGLVTATEIAYYSYLFAMISDEHYRVITSFTRAFILLGRLAAYLTGQLLVSFDLMDYRQLNIISFTSVSVVMVLALFFKRPTFSNIFFKKETEADTNEKTETDTKQIEVAVVMENASDPELRTHSNGDKENQSDYRINASRSGRVKQGLLFLWEELKILYSCKEVVIWSCWWAFASCGHLQVGNYIQNLWIEISPDKKTIYNGAVEAFGTLISAVSVLIFGFIPVNWSRPGLSETIMSIFCIFNTVVVIAMAKTTSIWACYVIYSAFRATYHTVIALATLQIARSLSKQRYGFVFGVNMFATLVIETILTVTVVDKAGLGVDIRTQFVVYGGYFGFIGCVFLGATIYTVYKNDCSYKANTTENTCTYDVTAD